MRTDWYYYVSGVGTHLEIGMCLRSELGTVYQVKEKWPSIGGTTYPKVTLQHLRSGEEHTWNMNDMRYSRLKVMDPNDVELALLAE